MTHDSISLLTGEFIVGELLFYSSQLEQFFRDNENAKRKNGPAPVNPYFPPGFFAKRVEEALMIANRLTPEEVEQIDIESEKFFKKEH